jgi:2-(1,2-epoxy-1,2-dihydrophenyl)acetyl-CoA isomerase
MSNELNLHRDGAVLVIELNRPERLNALTPQITSQLSDAVARTAADDTVRCVVLTGAGRAFSAGADLKANDDAIPASSGEPDLGQVLRDIHNPLILALRKMPQPLVAAVNGVAAGIGCSYALACDYVVAARSASFLLAFVNAALVPDGGASVLVPARAGMGRALQMALLGEKVSATTALEWGLANELVDDQELMPAALAVAHRLAVGPPRAQAAIKALLNAAVLPTLRESLVREAEAQSGRSGSPEVAEALAAFLAKRPADYAGSTPQTAAAHD